MLSVYYNKSIIKIFPYKIFRKYLILMCKTHRGDVLKISKADIFRTGYISDVSKIFLFYFGDLCWIYIEY